MISCQSFCNKMENVHMECWGDLSALTITQVFQPLNCFCVFSFACSYKRLFQSLMKMTPVMSFGERDLQFIERIFTFSTMSMSPVLTKVMSLLLHSYLWTGTAVHLSHMLFAFQRCTLNIFDTSVKVDIS